MTTTVTPGAAWTQDEIAAGQYSIAQPNSAEGLAPRAPEPRRRRVTLVTESGDDALGPVNQRGRRVAIAGAALFAALLTAIVASSAVANRPTLGETIEEPVDGGSASSLLAPVPLRITAEETAALASPRPSAEQPRAAGANASSVAAGANATQPTGAGASLDRSEGGDSRALANPYAAAARSVAASASSGAADGSDELEPLANPY